jgi:biopolymer transport protein ExbD
MFSSIQSRRDGDSGPVVDIAPLIDVVFLLLIFFLVTTTFVKDTIVDVQRAEAKSAASTERISLRVSITADGGVYSEGAAVDLAELGRRVERAVASQDLRSVIVIPDREVPAGRLVEVMDAVRQAGMRDVAIAAERVR